MYHSKQVFLRNAQKNQQSLLVQAKNLKGELSEMQTELYYKNKPIRVTDDDYSTIIANLGKLFGKLNNFAPSCKVALRKDLTAPEMTKIMVEHLFDTDQEQIRGLFQNDKIDFAFVAALIEKFLIETLVKQVFKRGIHLDDVTNEAFHALTDLFQSAGHNDWIEELRLKLAKSTAELSENQLMIDRIKQGKQSIVEGMVNKLMLLYSDRELIQPRLEKLVDMAAELCLPMNGQDNLIELYYLSPGERIIPKQVKPANRAIDKEGSQIYLGISPVFLVKSTIEEDDIPDSYVPNTMLIFAGKAIW